MQGSGLPQNCPARQTVKVAVFQLSQSRRPQNRIPDHGPNQPALRRFYRTCAGNPPFFDDRLFVDGRPPDFRPHHLFGDTCLVRQTIREVCRRTGAKSIEARITLPVEDAEGLLFPVVKGMTRKTKIVVLDHISSPTGLIVPIKRLAAAARATCGHANNVFSISPNSRR